MAKGEGVHRMCQYSTAGTGSRADGERVGSADHDPPCMGVRRSQVEMRGRQSGVEGIKQEVDGMFVVVSTLAYN
jgi:hypothetical protein